MLLDDQNRRVDLGPEIGRGGEARVATIVGVQEVAKIYHKQPSNEKSDKLRILRNINNDQLQMFTALPTRLLYETSSKQLVGFAMPHAAQKQPIFQLIGPKSRKRHFPDKDYRFLSFVALNVAKAFASLHARGIVIGDVNESGLLVGQDGKIFFIDCDSFQVRQNGRNFLCEVGVPGFTPPELQGRDLRVERTIQHDCFGLSVLIFQLLFMGRHPFVGRFIGTGEMPMERAIAESRFAFAGRSSLQMLPPVDALQLQEVGELASLFERSFLSRLRPEAQEWIPALESFQKALRCCSANRSHWFSAAARECPWCRIENNSGLLLFAFVTLGSSRQGEAVSIASLWAAIEAVPVFVSGPFPALRGSFSPTPRALEKAKETRKQKMISICCFCAAFGALVLMLSVSPGIGVIVLIVGLGCGISAVNKINQHPLRKGLREESRQIRVQLNQLQGHWRANAYAADFQAEKAKLKGAKEQLVLLPQNRAKKLRDLEASKRDCQLQQFLEGFSIADADIGGIGRGRKATLRAYNVYTAADITPFFKVPGFGPTYMGKLCSWRQSLELRFVFDPKKAIDPALIRNIEQEYRIESKTLAEALQVGAKRLDGIRQSQASREKEMRFKAEALLARLGQIDADLHVL